MLNNNEVKRGRGRPRKIQTEEDQNTPKRGRGRPRKYPVVDEVKVKRGRGRPRKYEICTKEVSKMGVISPVYKKVDSGYLMQQLLNYFTKLLILHNQLSKEVGQHAVIYSRLKNLDFQMAEICKTILSREYPGVGEIEEAE